MEVIPSCLRPVSQGAIVPAWKSPTEAGAGSVGSGLLGMYLKGLLAGQFTICRSWLVPKGALHPESARPQDVKAFARETRKCGYYINIMHKSHAEERVGRSCLIIHVKKNLAFCLVWFVDWLMSQQRATLLFI